MVWKQRACTVCTVDVGVGRDVPPVVQRQSCSTVIDAFVDELHVTVAPVTAILAPQVSQLLTAQR